MKYNSVESSNALLHVTTIIEQNTKNRIRNSNRNKNHELFSIDCILIRAMAEYAQFQYQLKRRKYDRFGSEISVSFVRR